ncbi:MAG TPA: DHH family phosphoesterase [Candidatus Moranbacteria bacterium]|nr:DHH family phosphoesterase [Candidatus Moranbacteria bacterium]
MSLSSQEQFKKFLETSKEVLILIPENPSADAVGSAWALYYFLEKLNILPAIAFSNHLSEKFTFLPRPQNILSEISGARDFVLSFNTAQNKIMRVRHEEKGDIFNILVTPEKGSIDPRDFSFILAKFKYDLAIVIGCSDLEKLGKLYLDNTDLFFEVPIVNIDHKSDNDNFGQINLTDITASSSSEILARTFEEINPELIDKKIATCLLTGLIGATDSFQKKNTTPKALSASAALMDKGADQQEIVRFLYKTHPLHILKLWGRAMAKINWDEESQLIWSALTVEDFVQSRSSIEDLSLIISKLEENFSEGQIFMAVYNDTPQSSVALIRISNSETAKKIISEFPENFKRGFLEIKIENSNLIEAGKSIAEKIKNIAIK